ncbi:hypothetical protein M0R45_032393 [Rubus argutus]|uniref:Uncharacterized protein n=1 Tax=Rubus argutus TaxID=59490 RepID=A0AAW1WL04_RUBAR
MWLKQEDHKKGRKLKFKMSPPIIQKKDKCPHLNHSNPDHHSSLVHNHHRSYCVVLYDPSALPYTWQIGNHAMGRALDFVFCVLEFVWLKHLSDLILPRRRLLCGGSPLISEHSLRNFLESASSR